MARRILNVADFEFMGIPSTTELPDAKMETFKTFELRITLLRKRLSELEFA